MFEKVRNSCLGKSPPDYRDRLNKGGGEARGFLLSELVIEEIRN